MLFAPETDDQAHQVEVVVQALESEEISGAEAARRLLAIHPDFTLAYFLVGGDHLTAGEAENPGTLGIEDDIGAAVVG